MSSIHDRLRQARIDAGFETMTSAATHFGWKIPTYAGHENGSRGIKPPDIQKYAEAYGVTSTFLMTGKADHPYRKKPASGDPLTGFSDAPLAAFHGRTDSERRALLSLAEHAHPKPRHAALYRATRHIPGASLMNGDVLIIDLHPTPRNGQLMVVQAQQAASGEAETLTAIYRDGQSCPVFGEPDFPPGGEITIMGGVVASVRIG